MKVSEMMKYPKIKDLLEKYWDNDESSGLFNTGSMTDKLWKAFVWWGTEEGPEFWGNLYGMRETDLKDKYPDLFTSPDRDEYCEQIHVTTRNDSHKRSIKVKDLNTLSSYQLIARLLLNTSHEYSGHKQVIFNTYMTQEDLLSIADCINKILEEEEQEGFVTIRWSGPKSVDLYINDAWGGEGNNGHKDKLIAAWEW